METLVMIVEKLFNVLNAATPLAVVTVIIGALAFIIYQLVGEKGNVRLISDNHLSGLPDLTSAIDQLVESSKRQENSLNRIANDISYLKGRIQ